MPLVFADHVWVPRAAGSIRSADPSSSFPNTSKPPSRSTTKLIRLNSGAWDSHIGSTTLPGHYGANLLRSFSNVKVLHVKTDIVRGLSRSLHSEDGEPFLELLPHLEDLTYSEGEVADATMPVIDERQTAGHLVRCLIGLVGRCANGIDQPDRSVMRNWSGMTLSLSSIGAQIDTISRPQHNWYTCYLDLYFLYAVLPSDLANCDSR
jgi:hypothetical protein